MLSHNSQDHRQDIWIFKVIDFVTFTASGGSRISPRWGRQLSREALTYDLAKFSQKLHEIERIWTSRGDASLVPPLDPPLI